MDHSRKQNFWVTLTFFGGLFLFSFIHANAQLIELPNVELISEKEGLPFNSITDIVQDQRGFMWLAGRNGLARYDGYTFLELPKDSESGKLLSESIITSLSKDANGMIWAGGINGRVFRIDPSKFEVVHFQMFTTQISSLSNVIFGDSAGNVWCYAEGVGLYKYDGKGKFNFIDVLDQLPTNGSGATNFYNKVTSFYEESADVLWLATRNGLYRFDAGKLKIQHISSLSEDPNQPAFLHYIVADGRGGFWCSTWGNGLLHLAANKIDYKVHLFEKGYKGTSNVLYGIVRKNDHEIWVSAGGLGVFNEATETFSFFYDADDIYHSVASSQILKDPAGTVWLVSDQGLMKFSPNQNKFNFFKLKVTHSDNRKFYGVTDILLDTIANRKIIATTYADGLHVIDSRGKETILPVYLHPKSEPYQIINDLLQDDEGNVWVVTRDQLYQLTRDNKLIKIDEPSNLIGRSLPAYLYRIIQATNGDYWLASSRNGLFQLSSKARKWKKFTTQIPNTLASNRVFHLEEDSQHRIWVVHPLGGISIYNPKNEKWNYLKYTAGDSTGLVSDVYTEMTRMPSGKMVFATLEGISVIDPEKMQVRNLTQSNGLTNHSIYSIMADPDGNLWAVNNRGLAVLSEDGKTIREFNADDGLKGVYASFFFHRQGHQTYIGTYQGYYGFDTREALQEVEHAAPIFITGLKNQGTDLGKFNIPSSINISHNTNALTIEFAALNYMGTNKTRYEYKMDGLDKTWSTTRANQVVYSGIPSGHYTFRVKTLGNQETEATLLVTVSTPFWKQTWFRFLLVAIGMSGVYFVYRIRLNQVRQEEKLKTDFNQKLAEVEMKALKAQMSPHFIFNSLNSINRYIIKAEPEKASLYLTKFSKLIRLILDNSNNKIISLEQELTALKLYIELEALRFNEKFNYTLHINPELNPMSVGVPPMIIQPFIENAIWHGLLHKETPGQLDISIERFGSGLQCIITDNGIGRKKAADLKSKSVNKDKSYGMKITNDRLNMLNGESKVSSVEIIDLEDGHGNALGTKVILKIMSAELEPEF